MCSVYVVESQLDFQLRKVHKPLLKSETIKEKSVANPPNFRGALMVTTFIRLTGSRTNQVWRFLGKASQVESGVQLSELEYLSLKKRTSFCSGRVPIYVHPSLYRALKLKFLKQAIGILNPKGFETVVDTE